MTDRPTINVVQCALFAEAQAAPARQPSRKKLRGASRHQESAWTPTSRGLASTRHSAAHADPDACAARTGAAARPAAEDVDNAQSCAAAAAAQCAGVRGDQSDQHSAASSSRRGARPRPRHPPAGPTSTRRASCHKSHVPHWWPPSAPAPSRCSEGDHRVGGSLLLLLVVFVVMAGRLSVSPCAWGPAPGTLGSSCPPRSPAESQRALLRHSGRCTGTDYRHAQQLAACDPQRSFLH